LLERAWRARAAMFAFGALCAVTAAAGQQGGVLNLYSARHYQTDEALYGNFTVGFVWPNQSGNGTHVNVSGGAVAKNAPNRANAVAFLEYLSSAEAQGYFANGNNEWPAVKGAVAANPALESLGTFKADDMPVAAIGKSIATAQKILDRVGYQ
jgi:ABC-type Fe3+ transport system substrate-binding protein